MNVYSVTSETGMQIFVGIIIIGPSPGSILLSATKKDLIKWSPLTFDNIPRLVLGPVTLYLSP